MKRNTIADVIARLQPTPGGCWEWTGPRTFGYGKVSWHGRSVRVHRLVYESFIGPIPDGLTLDHLCCNKACANPAHLEPVTSRENTFRADTEAVRNKRKTHCIQGHEFTPDNTYVYGPGYRGCRECRRAVVRQRRAKARDNRK